MNTYTLESFISFCDEMMIANESCRVQIGNCKTTDSLKFILYPYTISEKRCFRTLYEKACRFKNRFNTRKGFSV